MGDVGTLKAAMEAKEFKITDDILTWLGAEGKLPDPCPIRISIRDGDDVRLWIGPRDWQWDFKTGQLVGAGTCLDDA